MTTGPTPHFTWSELTIRKGVAGADLDSLYSAARLNLIRLAEVLEVIRASVGKPLRVTSGYRHGDKFQHGYGQAADIQADGLSPTYLLRFIRRLHNAGLFPHQLRQVIAESLHGDEESVSEPMGEGSGQWVHIAIMGLPGEKFSTPANSMWLSSWDPTNGDRVYRSVS
jgi:hypothetical protein